MAQILLCIARPLPAVDEEDTICMRSLALAATLLMATALISPAAAGPITFDFGSALADQATNGQGIFSGGGEVTFTQDGVPVGARGYGGIRVCGNASLCLRHAYVTQKPGTFGSGETGLGESNGRNQLSDPTREVAPGGALVVDNRGAIAAGYSSSQLFVGSLQAGEGVMVYGLNHLGDSSLTIASFLSPSTFLGIRLGCQSAQCTGGVLQSIQLANTYNYFVLLPTLRINEAENSPDDFVLSEDILSTPTKVPEPFTLSLFGAGLLGLAGLLRRKQA